MVSARLLDWAIVGGMLMGVVACEPGSSRALGRRHTGLHTFIDDDLYEAVLVAQHVGRGGGAGEMQPACVLIEGEDPSAALLDRLRAPGREIWPESQCTRPWNKTPRDGFARVFSVRFERLLTDGKVEVTVDDAAGHVAGSRYFLTLQKREGLWYVLEKSGGILGRCG